MRLSWALFCVGKTMGQRGNGVGSCVSSVELFLLVFVHGFPHLWAILDWADRKDPKYHAPLASVVELVDVAYED
ncbi:hypothetical protein LZ30DRAFT_714207 [Colletotrichum cereale]|nr:hypothetical protein LZ30DRAFT_714207 [Colletotrichum cereale]